MNSVDQVLTDFSDYCQRAGANCPKKHKPILVLETSNGTKTLKVIQDRSSLSIFVRIAAFFGFGKASLKNIADFLKSHKFTFQEDLDQDVVYRTLQAVDGKIIKRNSHSCIQKIEPISLTKCIEVENYGFLASTTYHPVGSTPYKDTNGILDFCHVFPKNGIAYIADGTSHGKPEKRVKLKAFWDNFNMQLPLEYNSKMPFFKNQSDVRGFLHEQFIKLNNEMVDSVGTASTMSLAILFELNAKKYVAFMHVGDSSLFHMNKDGVIEKITEKDELELGILTANTIVQFDFREVKSGDRIYGLTDGVTDFLSEQQLNDILIDEATTKDNLLWTLETAITKTANYDATDSRKSDDISAFVIVVP